MGVMSPDDTLGLKQMRTVNKKSFGVLGGIKSGDLLGSRLDSVYSKNDTFENYSQYSYAASILLTWTVNAGVAKLGNGIAFNVTSQPSRQHNSELPTSFPNQVHKPKPGACS